MTNDANNDFVHLPTNSIIYFVGGGVLGAMLVIQIVAYVVILRKTGGEYAQQQAAQRARDLGIPA